MPLMLGITRKVKARLLRRQGPSVLLPYRDLWKLMHKEAVLAHNFAQRASINEFHHDERQTVGFADLVDRADIRMVERRNRARLSLEPLAEIRADDLDGDGAIQARVSGFVNLAHPSRAQRRLDLVRAESRAGGQRHYRGFYAITAE